MDNKDIKYLSYAEVLNVYDKTIKHSGGGFSGVLDQGKIESFLEFVQIDEYYPTFVDNLNYLVYRFCSGHCFTDGNKRIALTIGAYFLYKNERFWAATTFMSRLESTIYQIAASNIDDRLSYRIMECVVDCVDFDEELKIDIANAMRNGQTFNED